MSIIDHVTNCLLFCIVQWSRKEQFGPEVGEFVICDVRNKEYTIPGLENVSFALFCVYIVHNRERNIL